MAEPLRLLIVAASAAEAAAADASLKAADFHPVVHCVNSVGALQAALTASKWDTVLLACTGPGPSAAEALELVRSLGGDAPAFVLADAIGEEQVAALLRGGAVDFILRSNTETRLAQSVRRELAAGATRIRAERHVAMLQKASLAIAEAADFDAALSSTLQVVCEAAGLAYGISWIPDLVANELYPGPAWHIDDARLRKFSELNASTRYAHGAGAVGRSWQTRLPQWNPDVQQNATGSFIRIAAMRAAGLRTLFTVPICARDEVLAVLGFGMLEVRREDEALMQTVAAIARQLGAALLRKRSEQALQESEERFRATVNAAPSGIAHISLAGRYLLVNDTLCRMLGYERDELLSKSVADVIHPDERAGTAHRMQRLCAGELSVVRTEKRNVHKNGSVIWCAVTATIKRSDSGEPEYLISVLNDISERKEIEKQLVESESRYRQLIHNLPIGIMVHVDDKVAFANPAAARLLAADSAECLVGMATLDIMHPDERDAGAVSAAAALSDGGQGYTAERKIARFDGTSGISELTALPLVFDGKQGLLVATTDITERRAAEQRLLEARVSSDKLLAQLDTLLASAPTGFAFIDRSYRYVRVNDALAAVNGISAQAHIGRYVRDVVPDRWSQIEPIYRSLLEAGGSSATIEVQGSARAPGHWLINYYPVKVGQEVIGVGVIVVDIGERRKMEEQLRHLQKMEAIGALTGGVAHDFNNLLTIVIGNLELIQERVAAEPVLARQIDAAIVAARHGADLTSRLLAFSRQHPLQPVVLDVNEQISKAVPLLRRKLGETIRIQVRLDPNLWPAHVDLGQFENAILNLANNARDAMPIGGSLDLETSNIAIDPEAASQMTEVASGEYVKLSVRDTGTGMPKEIVDRVFEPFFTTKEVGKGTGLGLSMVYGFAKQSGGHVSISSVPGEGTEIALYLPRARRDTALPEVRGTELGEAVRVVLDHVNVNVTTDVTN